MKKKTFNRVFAMFSAVLMLVGMFPSVPAAVVAAESTGSEGTAVAKKAYVMDAADLKAEQFGADGKVTEDIKVGTDGYFTVASKGGKNSLKTLADKLECNMGEYSQALNLGGGLNTSTGQAGITFTTTEPVKVIAYVAVKAVNNKHSFQYAKAGAKATSIEMENDTSIVNKIEFNLDEAGQYWLGGNNGGNFLYVEVQSRLPEYTVDGASIDASKFNADGKLIADDTLSGFFSVYKNGDKTKLVTGQSVAYGKETLTTSLRLDGSPSFADGKEKSAITFTAKQDFRLTLVAAQKGSGVPELQYAKDGGATVTLADAVFEKGTAAKYTVELPAGTYKFGSKNGLDIFDMSVKYIEKYEMNANDLDVSNAGEDGKFKVTADTAVGTDGYFTVAGKGSKNVFIKLAAPAEYKGVTYNNKLQLSGATKLADGTATIKVNVEKTAKITLVAAAKGASGEGTNLIYAKTGVTSGTAIGQLGVTDEIGTYTLENVKPGTYYIGSAKGADIYDIKVEYDPEENKQAVAWDTVEAPVINSVTTDADGNFVVNFTSVIDELKGAENVKVTMLEGGYEVSTVNVKAQTDSVTFTPLWSGDYTFTAVAQRVGAADKSSGAYSYGAYTLAVRKPVITWAQNKGNGSVYLDWVNIEDADSYAVSYREAGSTGDFTYAVKDLKASQADYTVTGLEAGKSYEFKVEAIRNSDGFVANAVATVEVKKDADQKWYVATVGSAQTTNAVITAENGTVTKYDLDSQEQTANKQNNVEALDISNTNGTIEIASQTSGKISDDEDGFSYYYTKIDPDTENFKLSATFTVTDTSKTPDNQTGFGVVAADTLGINNWGKVDYVHKYFNYASSMVYSSKSKTACMRNVTGYTSADSSNNDGVDRVVTKKDFKAATSFAANSTYEFSLEKTDEGYTAVCNGEELKNTDNSFTSVQEDGTVVVGVMVSRKIGVKISNIKFTKSESKGITSNDKGDDKIVPSGRVYSSNTVGAASYEFIYVPNCDGTLKVTGPDGKTEERVLSAGDAARVNVAVNIGDNKISYTYAPKASDKITSTDELKGDVTVKRATYGEENGVLIVSPDGTKDGDATEAKPLNLATAVQYAQPGQTIVLKDGTYKDWISIQRSVSGTASRMITLVAENTGKAVFEGCGLSIIGDYWHVYGIYVKDSSGVGIQINGNNNIVEMCTVEHAANSGIQISRSGGADNKTGIKYKLWPTDNLVKNCESFDNCDAGRNDADGFAAKLTCGNGNRFYGCISHNNIDDGWDLYAKSVSGEIGLVTIENCVAYNNGWLTTDDITDPNYEYGEGNGFKLGGGYLKGGHVLKNSITFDNHAKGITSNSCPDIKIYDCTSYNNSIKNSAYNVGLNTKDSNRKEWVVKGLISLNNDKNTKLDDLIPFALHSEDNYIYNGSASYNNLGVEATKDWFVNVDTSVLPTRNEDGTINMHGLLELNDTAPANSGARLDVTSAEAKSVKPSTVAPGKVEQPEINVKEDAPATNVNYDFADVLTDDEWEAYKNGENVKITVEVKNADTTVTEDVKKLVEEKVTEEIKGGVIGQYIDLSIIKKVGDKDPVLVENTKQPVTFSVTVPEKLVKSDREYSIVRFHDGVAEVIKDANTETVDGKIVITFSTSKFSTYAIVYKDKVDNKPGNDDNNKGDTPTVPTVPTQPTTPDNSNNGNADGSTGDAATAPSTESGEGATTGDTARPVVYAVLAMMAAGLVLSVVVYDNKKKRI